MTRRKAHGTTRRDRTRKRRTRTARTQRPSGWPGKASMEGGERPADKDMGQHWSHWHRSEHDQGSARHHEAGRTRKRGHAQHDAKPRDGQATADASEEKESGPADKDIRGSTGRH